MLAVRNGDYVPQAERLQTVSGNEALLQRILLKLTARRGKFPFMEDFGSRLWTLGQLPLSARQAAAEQYAAEALSDEPGLTVEDVTLAESDDGALALTVKVAVAGQRLTAEVTLR